MDYRCPPTHPSRTVCIQSEEKGSENHSGSLTFKSSPFELLPSGRCNPPGSTLPHLVLVQSGSQTRVSGTGALTRRLKATAFEIRGVRFTRNSSYWPTSVTPALQSPNYSQAQEQFLPPGNPTYEQLNAPPPIMQ